MAAALLQDGELVRLRSVALDEWLVTSPPDDWDDKLHPALIKYQESDGHWKSEGPHAKKTGDVIATCWAIMALNAKYRCLPILNPKAGGSSSDSNEPTEG